MKARNKAVLIIIIALAVALIGTIALGFNFMLDAAKNGELYNSVLREQGEMLDELHTLDVEKGRLEEQNIKLESENKKLKAALVAAMTTQPAESTEPEPVEEVDPLLPPQDIPTNIYRCEPYMVIDLEKSDDAETVYKIAFSNNSEQAALQEDCFTDIETGIRYYFDTSDGSKWYCAALAGAYGIEVGHCYIFTLANGTELPVMLADYKHDISDPKPDDYGDDDTNYDGEKCLNVIEFVVDMPTIPKAARDAGTMSALDKFGGLYGHGGNIVDAEDAGRRWKA